MQRMVSRILEQQKEIHQVLHDGRKYHHLVPTWQDVDVLESPDTAFGAISDFTDMLSAENFITVLAVLPVIHHIIKKEMLSIGDDDNQLTKDIKTRILSYLKQKYTDAEICELLNLAIFLNPQFITVYVPTMIKVSVTKDRLAREETEIRLTEAGEDQNTEDTADQNQTQRESSEPPLKRKKTWKLAKKQPGKNKSHPLHDHLNN